MNMDVLELKNIFSIINKYDVFLFDIWGVITDGEMPYEGVTDIINKIMEEKKVFFVSNAPRTSLSIYEKIKKWKINVSPEMIITSGEIARRMINESEGNFNIIDPVIYHLGHDRNNNIMSGMTHNVTTNIHEANIMLMTYYRDEGENLEELNDLLKNAAKLNIINICANPDIIAPNLGKSRYCSGYFAAKLEEYGGSVVYTGKPHNEIFEYVISKLYAIPKNRILMIGDTFHTDILGANRIGIDSALVLTGNAKIFHKQYYNIDEKLTHLKIASLKEGATPTFVLTLTS